MGSHKTAERKEDEDVRNHKSDPVRNRGRNHRMASGQSTLALNRYNQRQQGSLQKTPQMTAAAEDSRTDLEKFLDKHFPDKRMEQIYPNAKTVVDGKPVSQKDMKEKRKSS